MRHDAAPSETTLPKVAIRKADRLSVTACCEAPRARLAFEVRKRVDPHSEHARRQRPFSSRASGRLTPHRRMSMTSRASADHVPSLRADAREEVGKLLQATLVELLDLALVGKQLHWSVTGPHFRPLHEQLDELVDSWHELADTVAEREVTIGYWPDGQARAIAADSKLAPIERGGVEELMVVAELAHRVAKAGNNARERMDELIDLDLVSQDVLIDVVRKLEEQLWMIRSQLPHGART
jgi:starvation-inducible DNA-binding protein